MLTLSGYVFTPHSISDVNCIFVLTFRDLLQPGEHLGQFLLALSQLTSAREVHSEQSHDGVDYLGMGGSEIISTFIVNHCLHEF